MKTVIFFFGLTIILVSCRIGQVSVQLQNKSEYTIKEITIRLGDTLKTFKDLAKDAKTPSFITNAQYGYGYTRIVMPNNDTVTLRPVDYVGEKKYNHGKLLLKFYLNYNRETKKYHILYDARRRF